MTDNQLANTLFIRYPQKNAPKDMEEFFSQFMIMEDFDTASSEVAKHLLSFSPSLNENEGDESALAIFKSNDRHQGYRIYIENIFKQENVSKEIFNKKLKKLLRQFPLTKKGGLITQVFLPKSAPLSKVLYRSLEYGIPYNISESIHQFFEDYYAGKLREDNPVPQLRFLPSAMTQENGFNFDEIYMVRYTMLSQDQLRNFAEKVNRVVKNIFKAHRTQMQEFETFREEVFERVNASERHQGLTEIANFYFDHYNLLAALEYIQKIENTEIKGRFITFTIWNLINEADWQIGEQMILDNAEGSLPDINKLLAVLCLRYAEFGQIVKIKDLMISFPNSPQKNFIALFCASQFSEEKEYFESQLSTEFSILFDELAEMNILEIERP